MPFLRVNPVINYRVRGLCSAPYPGHKKGCPNFNKKERCPPKSPKIEQVLDLSQPVWAIYNAFDLGAYVIRMKEKHPNWSERQLYNCLYWQPSARKTLKGEIKKFLLSATYADFATQGKLTLAGTPEAMGVDITATMLQAGIKLEWPPKSLAYQIVLIGYPVITL